MTINDLQQKREATTTETLLLVDGCMLCLLLERDALTVVVVEGAACRAGGH